MNEYKRGFIAGTAFVTGKPGIDEKGDEKGEVLPGVEYKASSAPEMSPRNPDAIRQRMIDELIWSIDQAKVRNDHASVASYASMLLPFVRMG